MWKLLLSFRGKVTQLWVGLAVFSALFLTLQLSGVLRLNRCDQELKRLLLHHISGIQSAILTQKRSPLGVLDDSEQGKSHKLALDPPLPKDEVNLLELRQEFIMSNLEVNDPEAQQMSDRATALGDNNESWILHANNFLAATAQGAKVEDRLDSVAEPSFGQKNRKEKPPLKDKPGAANKQELVDWNKTLSSSKDGQMSQGELTMEASLPSNKTHKSKFAVHVITKGSSSINLKPAKEQKSHTEDSNNVLGKTKITLTRSSNMSSSSPVMNCEPQTNIVFLKIHKSASSTIMNILFRFGETHNLTFALPRNSVTQLYYPRYFMAPFVEGYSEDTVEQFNIMCHHMRFQRQEVEKVMPYNTFYFAILRNPVQLMESSFAYYKAISAFSRTKTLEEFLADPSLFYTPRDHDSHYAKNLMTFDFGFNNNGNSSTIYSQMNILAIDAIFNLILIAEYFDESMILLKEALCWKINDVLSFPLNSRDDSTRLTLSENTAEQVKSWNKLDWELYNYFNRTFWEKIDRFVGRDRMKQEVAQLRQRREQLAKTCLEEGSKVDPKSIKDESLVPLQYGRARIQGYNVKAGLNKEKRQLCESLIRPELQYSSLLYKKQFPEKAKALEKIKLAHQKRANKISNNTSMRPNERFPGVVHRLSQNNSKRLRL
ncbi:galactose-3-O-sulfotransferase 2-like isoform X2 [Pleurodeles waltl]|uniref:galactose-3-O-sulfotransferase 2-like isoform X2 n=1 Tax=Pleurodeles waltl TaxID=8319 RepID=UPI003709508F